MDNKLLIPGAIILAGVIIAGALVLSRSGNLGTTGTPADTSGQTADIQVAPLSADDHLLGNPGASIAAIVFSDLECPFCKTFHATMHQVIDTYGKDGHVAWVYRHFPLTQIHPKAPREAEASECAAELGGNTGFWNYVDRIFAITPSNNGLDLALLSQSAADIGLDQSAFDTCLASGTYASEVEKDLNDAIAAGGTGTPYTVLLLKEPLSAAAQNVVEGLAAQFNTPQHPRTITISEDKKKVGISGALPFETVLKLIIDAILF